MNHRANALDEYDAACWAAARQLLTTFVQDQANKTAADVGFGWVATRHAPDNYRWLCEAVERSRHAGVPLPISSENNDNVIYLTPEANVAFRFWHDVTHVMSGLSFELVDELEVALGHLGELEAQGVARGSLPWRLLHADLIGQVQIMALAQRFPIDQRHFVDACVTGGFERGLIAEAHRSSRGGPSSTRPADDAPAEP